MSGRSTRSRHVVALPAALPKQSYALLGRGCTGINERGERCGATKMRDGDYCFWHAPEREVDAAEARRLGGLRRKREKTLAGAFEVTGLDSVPAIRRVVELVMLEALGLDNSVARCRILLAAATTAVKLLEVGELETRLALLEDAARSHPPEVGSLLGGLRGIGP